MQALYCLEPRVRSHDPAFVRAALQRAVDAIGMAELAKRLNTPSSLIRDWIDQHATMPDRKVFMLLDLLGEIDSKDQ